jgi:acyl-CoA reductase-like NAD-dependent aldehyde dehydrogenase
VKQLKQNQSQLGADSLPALLNYIDGSVEAPTVERGNMLRDPNNRQPLQPQLSCTPERVEAALAAAHAAYEAGEWENTPATERADILDRIADRLAQPALCERIAVADAITTGAIINTTRRMAQLAPFIFRSAASYIREGNLAQALPGKAGPVEYLRRPWGPALLVSPWNGPTAIGSHKIASALAAGAPCIMKPSEWAPHSALLMAEAIHAQGLPHGTFQLTCGSRHIGGQMVGDARIKSISFTGGTAGGRVIAEACARSFKPNQLELGGNNPLVVFEDADLEQASLTALPTSMHSGAAPWAACWYNAR